MRRLLIYVEVLLNNHSVMKYIFILTANWPKSILLVLFVIIIEDGFQYRLFQFIFFRLRSLAFFRNWRLLVLSLPLNLASIVFIEFVLLKDGGQFCYYSARQFI